MWTHKLSIYDKIQLCNIDRSEFIKIKGLDHLLWINWSINLYLNKLLGRCCPHIKRLYKKYHDCQTQPEYISRSLSSEKLNAGVINKKLDTEAYCHWLDIIDSLKICQEMKYQRISLLDPQSYLITDHTKM